MDKGFYDTFFPNINRPKTIIKNVNGYHYDDHNALTLEEAIERCCNLNESIIKPTSDGTWGQGVKLIKAENGMVPRIVLVGICIRNISVVLSFKNALSNMKLFQSLTQPRSTP